MGAASRHGPVSLLGDSGVSRRRQGQIGQAAEAPGAGSSHEAAHARAFFRGRARRRAGGLRLGGCAHQRKSRHCAQLGDKTGVAVSLNALAVFARDRGDVEVAHVLFEESLVLWRELGDQKAVARALSNLANVVKLQGDYARARSLYAECLSIFRGLGDRTGVAWSLNYQGDVARDQGDSAAAQTLYEQGLAMFRELDDRWGIAGTLADLGNLAREQGDYSTARFCTGKA